MKVPCIELGSLSHEMLSENWVLVFGGMRLNSLDRAAKTVKIALEESYQVVFFNPKEEQLDEYLLRDFSQEYNSMSFSEGNLMTIDCFNELERKPLRKCVVASKVGLDSYESQQGGDQAASIQILPVAVRRKVSNVLSKIHTLSRGFTYWRVVKDQVLKISEGIHPKIIIYFDEDSTAPAWHAAQIWADSEVKAYWEIS